MYLFEESGISTTSLSNFIQDMASYVGFLNAEMYQMFWMLILGIIIVIAVTVDVLREKTKGIGG